MKPIPKEVQKLAKERDRLRKEGKYKQSDALRAEIERMGYEVKDTLEGTRVERAREYMAPEESFLALFGSGEIAHSSVQTHSRVLEGIGKDRPRIVIISTPAGFQPNVKVVCEEIRDFFERHLQNFHPRVDIIYANTLEESNNPGLLAPLEAADYIFTGPGSPTYAVRGLTGSLLEQKITERVRQGASLGLASAAVMAFSRFCLPVYEIYKAGHDLYWEDGLNFYASVFRELTVISHWNNNEGGRKLDTSRAWMGKERFEKMRALLPPNHDMWGIDEHTAVLINLKTKQRETIGKGKLHAL